MNPSAFSFLKRKWIIEGIWFMQVQSASKKDAVLCTSFGDVCSESLVWNWNLCFANRNDLLYADDALRGLFGRGYFSWPAF